MAVPLGSRKTGGAQQGAEGVGDDKVLFLSLGRGHTDGHSSFVRFVCYSSQL